MAKKLELWLSIIALGHMMAGIALPFIAFSSIFDIYAAAIRESFFGGAPIPPETEAFQRWIVALFGPTVASWGVLMAYVVRAGTRTNDPSYWHALLLSVLAWAPADIAISLIHDFWIHVIVDLVAIIIIAIPVFIILVKKRC